MITDDIFKEHDNRMTKFLQQNFLSFIKLIESVGFTDLQFNLFERESTQYYSTVVNKKLLYVTICPSGLDIAGPGYVDIRIDKFSDGVYSFRYSIDIDNIDNFIDIITSTFIKEYNILFREKN